MYRIVAEFVFTLSGDGENCGNVQKIQWQGSKDTIEIHSLMNRITVSALM